MPLWGSPSPVKVPHLFLLSSPCYMTPWSTVRERRVRLSFAYLSYFFSIVQMRARVCFCDA